MAGPGGRIKMTGVAVPRERRKYGGRYGRRYVDCLAVDERSKILDVTGVEA